MAVWPNMRLSRTNAKEISRKINPIMNASKKFRWVILYALTVKNKIVPIRDIVAI
jgi:hypothetical protein